MLPARPTARPGAGRRAAGAPPLPPSATSERLVAGARKPTLPTTATRPTRPRCTQRGFGRALSPAAATGNRNPPGARGQRRRAHPRAQREAAGPSLRLLPPSALPLAGQLIQPLIQPPLQLGPLGWVQGPVLGPTAGVQDPFPADSLPGVGARPLPTAVHLRTRQSELGQVRTGPCSSARHGSGTVKAQPELSGAPPLPACGSFTSRLPGEGWRTRTLPLTPALASALTRSKQTTVCFKALSAHNRLPFTLAARLPRTRAPPATRAPGDRPTSGRWWLRQYRRPQCWQSWPSVTTLAAHFARPQVLSALMTAETRASKSSSGGRSAAPGPRGERVTQREEQRSQQRSLLLNPRWPPASCFQGHGQCARPSRRNNQSPRQV